MNWLSARIQPKTIRDFAGTLLKHRDWPRSLKLAQDSLRNRLHDADGCKKTDWWLKGKGTAALQPLAKALGVTVDELKRLLQQSAAQPEAGARIELDSFDGVFIDLEKGDTFPPGFPPELTVNNGSHLDCAWWTTTDLVAVGWVGSWLESRFGWHVRRMEKWDAASLPTSGKVFVELARIDEMPDDWSSTVPVETHVCIACRFPPQKPVSTENSPQAKSEQKQTTVPARRVTTLTTPPPREWIDALISWLAPRVPPGGRFKERTAARLTHAEYDGMTSAEPREVLSFLELVDNHEEAVFGGDRSRLIREWVSNAEARTIPENAQTIAKSGDELLLALNTARLKEVLGPQLTIEQWSDLLPSDYLPERIRREIDHRAQAGGAGNAAKLRKLLDPKNVDWVESLRRCDVLRASDLGLASIQPPLLARFVDELSFERLWASPDGFGTLMLNSATSAQAIRRLIDELLAGQCARAETWLFRGEHTVESLAACDGIFRAIGLALTVPAAQIPLGLIRQSWKTFAFFSDEAFSQTHRVPFVTVGVSSDDRGLNSEGAHLLATSAISLHLLRAGDAIALSALTPTGELFGEQPMSSQFWDPTRRSFSLITKAFQTAPAGSIERLAPYRLADALFQQFGHTPVYELTDLQQPAAIALYVANQASEKSLGRVGAIELDAVVDACARHSVLIDDALSKAWFVWARQGFNYVFPQLSPETAKVLFSGFTCEHLDNANQFRERTKANGRISLVGLDRHPEVWPFLRPEIWDYWVGTGFISAQMLPYFPESAVRQALRTAPYWLSGGGYLSPFALWATFPGVVADFIHGVVTDSEQPVYWPVLAYAAPPERVPDLVERLNGHNHQLVHEWLVMVVQKRLPGWREAAHQLMVSAKWAHRDSTDLALPGAKGAAHEPAARS